MLTLAELISERREEYIILNLYVELVDKKEKHLFSKVLHLFWNGGRCFIILTEMWT